MSNINKQAMREAAEKAILEEGETWRDDRQLAHVDGVYLTQSDAVFIASANPASVLALLDGLEAKEKQRAAANKVVVQQDIELQELRQRIAELEAREVVLQSGQDVHPMGPQSAKIFCEFHRNIVNRCADEIRKVGVNVSVKGG